MEGCSLELDDLVAAYDAAWAEPEEAEIRFGKAEDDESLGAMASRMLGAFLGAAQPGEIITVEESFAAEVDGILVSGIVDLVEVKDGRIWIVDAKTSKGEPSTAFDGEQVALYLLGLREVGLVPEGADVGLRYAVLRKLKTKGEFVPVEVQVAQQDLSRVRHKLQQIWRAIDSGVLYRVRSWACAGCPWSKRCAEVDLAKCCPT